MTWRKNAGLLPTGWLKGSCSTQAWNLGAGPRQDTPPGAGPVRTRPPRPARGSTETAQAEPGSGPGYGWVSPGLHGQLPAPQLSSWRRTWPQGGECSGSWSALIGAASRCPSWGHLRAGGHRRQRPLLPDPPCLALQPSPRPNPYGPGPRVLPGEEQRSGVHEDPRTQAASSHGEQRGPPPRRTCRPAAGISCKRL